ncbi:hypothetical protein ACWFRQ_02425 [Streptomyces niveus]
MAEDQDVRVGKAFGAAELLSVCRRRRLLTLVRRRAEGATVDWWTAPRIAGLLIATLAVPVGVSGAVTPRGTDGA